MADSHRRKILIFWPRLDTTFKQGPVPDIPQPLSPIRQHWHNFYENLAQYHLLKGHRVDCVHKPLWQMVDDDVWSRSHEYDVVYFPHKQKIDFNRGDNVRYVMQTVFPNFFTVDRNGWGANLSYLPLELKTEGQYFDVLKKKQEANISKFDQPGVEIPHKDYVLFVCQIPHDETIKYHSTVSVPKALKRTLDWAKHNKKRVLVKGHPVNAAAMVDLIKICVAYDNALYTCSEYSIFSCIRNAESIFLVNSGVGFEAILQDKPIFQYGRSEYEQVVNKITTDDFEYNLQVEKDKYRNFINTFMDECIDSTDINTYKILEEK